jgi:hypothetical protein
MHLQRKAAEDQLAAVNAKEQELLTERANIIQELEQGFGVEREGFQTNIANLEGTVTDLQANIDTLTQERDAAIAEQDVIRATAADNQAKALADQRTDLQGQIDTLSASQPAETTGIQTAPTSDEYLPTLEAYNPSYMGFEDERMIGRQNEADALANLQAASAAGTASLSDVQAAKNASANLIAQEAFENRSVPITGQDLGISKPSVSPIDMSKINLPPNYLDQLQNIQLPRNLNFGNLRTGMAGGGDINKIEILLKKIG